MARRNSAALLLVITVILSLVGSPLAVAGSPSTDGIDDPSVAEIDADDVVMDVTIRSDGTAYWTIEHRVRLDDDETEAAFEELQRDLEANETEYVERFADRINRTVATAESATDREMAVSNISVSATVRSLPREYGVLTYQFEWEGFAIVDGEEITAGDALEGLFLDSASKLVIGWSDDYTLMDVSPEPNVVRGTSVTWNGPTDFGTNEPYVRLSSADDAHSDDDEAEMGDGSNGGQISATPLAWVGALIVSVVILVVGGFAFVRWKGRETTTAASVEGDMDDASGNDSPQTAHDASSTGNPPTAELDEQSAQLVADTSLLSNEEQVLQVVEAHDGRVKQQTVVQTLGWTDAKTSQVVSDLREAGKLESFRLGRENVLKVPEECEE